MKAVYSFKALVHVPRHHIITQKNIYFNTHSRMKPQLVFYPEDGGSNICKNTLLHIPEHNHYDISIYFLFINITDG